MNKRSRLARFFALELQSTAINIKVTVAQRPLRSITLIPAAKITVSVDEITDGIAVLFQRPQNFRTGSHPVRCCDLALEAKLTQKL